MKNPLPHINVALTFGQNEGGVMHAVGQMCDTFRTVVDGEHGRQVSE